MDAEAKEQIVEEVVRQIYEAFPWLDEKFGENGRLRTAEDNYHHLDHLEIAFEMDDSQFFINYTNWLNQLLTSRNVGTDLIIDNFERLAAVLPGRLDSQREHAYLHYLQEALDRLQKIS